MQLAFDSADRLVELVESRRGPVPAEDAARALFALRHVPAGLARSLLDDVVDGDARLAWRGASVGLAEPPGAELPLERRRTSSSTSRRPGSRRARARSARSAPSASAGSSSRSASRRSSTRGGRCPRPIAALTGIDPRALRGAPPVELAVRRFLEFAGDAVLVAHNARFDIAFLDREVERLTGRRIAAPVVDTVWLARRLLAGRTSRMGLASLSHFFGTAARPCHRALPDAEATAEILLALIGLAQERGAETVAELVELAAPRARRLAGKRSLVAGAPPHPGVYLFRDRNDEVLYVGRARDLRARLRSYFRTERQRPAVEAALGALERIEWRVLGSELEAGLGGAAAPARAATARRMPAAPAPTATSTCAGAAPAGASRRRPARTARSRAAVAPAAAARALEGWEGEPAAALPRAPGEAAPPRRRPPLRGRRPAARPDRRRSRRSSARSRSSSGCARCELCLLVPAAEQGFRRAFFVSRGPGRRSAHAAARDGGPRRGRGGPRSRRPDGDVRWPGGRGRAAADRLVPAPAAAGARGRAARRRSAAAPSLEPWPLSPLRPSPTGSRTRSSGSAASSSSGSIRASTCCRSSCAANPCSAAPRPRTRSRASAAGSSTPSRPTSSPSSRRSRSSRRSAPTASAPSSASARTPATPGCS